MGWVTSLAFHSGPWTDPCVMPQTVHGHTTHTVGPGAHDVEHVANPEGHFEAVIVHPIVPDCWIAS